MRIAFEEARKVLAEKLEKHGVPAWQAEKVGYEMARNSLEGIYTHGLNRFERLVRNIDEGIVIPGTEPELIHSFGAMENYDGRLGLGITNALFSQYEPLAPCCNVWLSGGRRRICGDVLHQYDPEHAYMGCH